MSHHMAQKIVAYTHLPELLPDELLGEVGVISPGREMRVFAPLDPAAFQNVTGVSAQVKTGRLERLGACTNQTYGIDFLRESEGETVALRLIELGGRHFFVGRGADSDAFYWHELADVELNE